MHADMSHLTCLVTPPGNMRVVQLYDCSVSASAVTRWDLLLFSIPFLFIHTGMVREKTTTQSNRKKNNGSSRSSDSNHRVYILLHHPQHLYMKGAHAHNVVRQNNILPLLFLMFTQCLSILNVNFLYIIIQTGK